MIFSQNIRSSVVSVLSTSVSFFQQWFPRFRFLGSALSATENNIYVHISSRLHLTVLVSELFQCEENFLQFVATIVYRELLSLLRRGGGEKKRPKRSAYIQRTIILSQTAILPPLTKTFRRKEKCSARSLQKDVSETWLLSKSPVIFQILWIIGFGTFGRWHQEWNELRLLFSLFGCEYTIISAFCNVLFFSQFQESLNIKSVRFNRARVWFLSQLC